MLQLICITGEGLSARSLNLESAIAPLAAKKCKWDFTDSLRSPSGATCDLQIDLLLAFRQLNWIGVACWMKIGNAAGCYSSLFLVTPQTLKKDVKANN